MALDASRPDLYLPFLGTEVEGVTMSFNDVGSFLASFDSAWIRVNNTARIEPATFNVDPWARYGTQRRLPIRDEAFEGKGVITPSGARLYPDTATPIDPQERNKTDKLLELATPPTDLPGQSAMLALGATRWMNYSSYGAKGTHQYTERGPRVRIEVQGNRLADEYFRNELGEPNFRIGFHQNVSLPEGFTSTDVESLRFLVGTMPVVVGEGGLDGEGYLQTSHRANVVTTEWNGLHVNAADIGWVTTKNSGVLSSLYPEVHSRRAEFSSNDFPTSDAAATLSNGILMAGVALHANGLAPDISDLLEKIPGHDPQYPKEGKHGSQLLRCFGGNVQDIEMLHVGLEIQQRYVHAGRELVRRINDQTQQESYRNVMDIWQRSIDQVSQYIEKGTTPEHPVAGWLHAVSRIHDGFGANRDEGFKSQIFRNYEDQMSQSDGFAFSKPVTRSNAFFRVKLEEAARTTETFIVSHEFDFVRITPVMMHDGRLRPSWGQRATFPMPVDKGVGNAQWVKDTFGTFNPEIQQIEAWAHDFIREHGHDPEFDTLTPDPPGVQPREHNPHAGETGSASARIIQ